MALLLKKETLDTRYVYLYYRHLLRRYMLVMYVSWECSWECHTPYVQKISPILICEPPVSISLCRTGTRPRGGILPSVHLRGFICFWVPGDDEEGKGEWFYVHMYLITMSILFFEEISLELLLLHT